MLFSPRIVILATMLSLLVLPTSSASARRALSAEKGSEQVLLPKWHDAAEVPRFIIRGLGGWRLALTGLPAQKALKPITGERITSWKGTRLLVDEDGAEEEVPPRALLIIPSDKSLLDGDATYAEVNTQEGLHPGSKVSVATASGIVVVTLRIHFGGRLAGKLVRVEYRGTGRLKTAVAEANALLGWLDGRTAVLPDRLRRAVASSASALE